MHRLAIALVLCTCAEEERAGVRIDRLVPEAAPPGARVEILGAGFGERADGAVTFGGADAAVLLWTDTRIAVEVPACARGAVYLVVAAGGARTEPAAFTALDPDGGAACADSGSM